jgi:hypothetical protein
MPALFTVVKFVHILLIIVAFGFNATYSIWIVRAQRDPEHLDFALRGVKFLDDYFANPAYLLLLVSGLAVVALVHYQLTTFWLAAALILWLVAIALGYGVYTVLQNLPGYGHTRPGVWFLLLRHQLHTGLALRARAGNSTGVLTVRGTPGQLLEIDGGVQISIQHQTALLTMKGPIREREIFIEPATAAAPLAGRLPPLG